MPTLSRTSPAAGPRILHPQGQRQHPHNPQQHISHPSSTTPPAATGDVVPRATAGAQQLHHHAAVVHNHQPHFSPAAAHQPHHSPAAHPVHHPSYAAHVEMFPEKQKTEQKLTVGGSSSTSNTVHETASIGQNNLDLPVVVDAEKQSKDSTAGAPNKFPFFATLEQHEHAMWQMKITAQKHKTMQQIHNAAGTSARTSDSIFTSRSLSPKKTTGLLKMPSASSHVPAVSSTSSASASIGVARMLSGAGTRLFPPGRLSLGGGSVVPQTAKKPRSNLPNKAKPQPGEGESTKHGEKAKAGEDEHAVPDEDTDTGEDDEIEIEDITDEQQQVVGATSIKTTRGRTSAASRTRSTGPSSTSNERASSFAGFEPRVLSSSIFLPAAKNRSTYNEQQAIFANPSVVGGVISLSPEAGSSNNIVVAESSNKNMLFNMGLGDNVSGAPRVRSITPPAPVIRRSSTNNRNSNTLGGVGGCRGRGPGGAGAPFTTTTSTAAQPPMSARPARIEVRQGVSPLSAAQDGENRVNLPEIMGFVQQAAHKIRELMKRPGEEVDVSPTTTSPVNINNGNAVNLNAGPAPGLDQVVKPLAASAVSEHGPPAESVASSPGPPGFARKGAASTSEHEEPNSSVDHHPAPPGLQPPAQNEHHVGSQYHGPTQPHSTAASTSPHQSVWRSGAQQHTTSLIAAAHHSAEHLLSAHSSHAPSPGLALAHHAAPPGLAHPSSHGGTGTHAPATHAHLHPSQHSRHAAAASMPLNQHTKKLDVSDTSLAEHLLATTSLAPEHDWVHNSKIFPGVDPPSHSHLHHTATASPHSHSAHLHHLHHTATASSAAKRHLGSTTMTSSPPHVVVAQQHDPVNITAHHSTTTTHSAHGHAVEPGGHAHHPGTSASHGNAHHTTARHPVHTTTTSTTKLKLHSTATTGAAQEHAHAAPEHHHVATTHHGNERVKEQHHASSQHDHVSHRIHNSSTPDVHPPQDTLSPPSFKGSPSMHEVSVGHNFSKSIPSEFSPLGTARRKLLNAEQLVQTKEAIEQHQNLSPEKSKSSASTSQATAQHPAGFPASSVVPQIAENFSVVENFSFSAVGTATAFEDHDELQLSKSREAGIAVPVGVAVATHDATGYDVRRMMANAFKDSVTGEDLFTFDLGMGEQQAGEGHEQQAQIQQGQIHEHEGVPDEHDELTAAPAQAHNHYQQVSTASAFLQKNTRATTSAHKATEPASSSAAPLHSAEKSQEQQHAPQQHAPLLFPQASAPPPLHFSPQPPSGRHLQDSTGKGGSESSISPISPFMGFGRSGAGEGGGIFGNGVTRAPELSPSPLRRGRGAGQGEQVVTTKREVVGHFDVRLQPPGRTGNPEDLFASPTRALSVDVPISKDLSLNIHGITPMIDRARKQVMQELQLQEQEGGEDGPGGIHGLHLHMNLVKTTSTIKAAINNEVAEQLGAARTGAASYAPVQLQHEHPHPELLDDSPGRVGKGNRPAATHAVRDSPFSSPYSRKAKSKLAREQQANIFGQRNGNGNQSEEME
ncbi:unnamed protein product, partial [Amoebophrya sp. A25]|eukprot:GSA25T00008683001.1